MMHNATGLEPNVNSKRHAASRHNRFDGRLQIEDIEKVVTDGDVAPLWVD